MESGTETGAELGKGGTVGTREDGFGRTDFGSGGVEDTVGLEGVDGFGDGSGVEVGEGLLVGVGRDGAIVGQVGGDVGQEFGLEGVFHGAGLEWVYNWFQTYC